MSVLQVMRSWTVRAQQQAAGAQKKVGSQALGRSRRGLNARPHLAGDALGNQPHVIVDSGQIADIDCAQDRVADFRYDVLIIGVRQSYCAMNLAYKKTIRHREFTERDIRTCRFCGTRR